MILSWIPCEVDLNWTDEGGLNVVVFFLAKNVVARSWYMICKELKEEKRQKIILHYNEDVRTFEVLENRWHQKRNMSRKNDLYKAVQKAEVKYAVRYGIYNHLLEGQQRVKALAKDKTRSRMRNRFKKNICIGLPTGRENHKTLLTHELALFYN